MRTRIDRPRSHLHCTTVATAHARDGEDCSSLLKTPEADRCWQSTSGQELRCSRMHRPQSFGKSN